MTHTPETENNNPEAGVGESTVETTTDELVKASAELGEKTEAAKLAALATIKAKEEEEKQRAEEAAAKAKAEAEEALLKAKQTRQAQQQKLETLREYDQVRAAVGDKLSTLQQRIHLGKLPQEQLNAELKGLREEISYYGRYKGEELNAAIQASLEFQARQLAWQQKQIQIEQAQAAAAALKETGVGEQIIELVAEQVIGRGIEVTKAELPELLKDQEPALVTVTKVLEQVEKPKVISIQEEQEQSVSPIQQVTREQLAQVIETNPAAAEVLHTVIETPGEEPQTVAEILNATIDSKPEATLLEVVAIVEQQLKTISPELGENLTAVIPSTPEETPPQSEIPKVIVQEPTQPSPPYEQAIERQQLANQARIENTKQQAATIVQGNEQLKKIFKEEVVPQSEDKKEIEDRKGRNQLQVVADVSKDIRRKAQNASAEMQQKLYDLADQVRDVVSPAFISAFKTTEAFAGGSSANRDLEEKKTEPETPDRVEIQVSEEAQKIIDAIKNKGGVTIDGKFSAEEHEAMGQDKRASNLETLGHQGPLSGNEEVQNHGEIINNAVIGDAKGNDPWQGEADVIVIELQPDGKQVVRFVMESHPDRETSEKVNRPAPISLTMNVVLPGAEAEAFVGQLKNKPELIEEVFTGLYLDLSQKIERRHTGPHRIYEIVEVDNDKPSTSYKMADYVRGKAVRKEVTLPTTEPIPLRTEQAPDQPVTNDYEAAVELFNQANASIPEPPPTPIIITPPHAPDRNPVNPVELPSTTPPPLLEVSTTAQTVIEHRQQLLDQQRPTEEVRAAEQQLYGRVEQSLTNLESQGTTDILLQASLNEVRQAILTPDEEGLSYDARITRVNALINHLGPHLTEQEQDQLRTLLQTTAELTDYYHNQNRGADQPFTPWTQAVQQRDYLDAVNTFQQIHSSEPPPQTDRERREQGDREPTAQEVAQNYARSEIYLQNRQQELQQWLRNSRIGERASLQLALGRLGATQRQGVVEGINLQALATELVTISRQIEQGDYQTMEEYQQLAQLEWAYRELVQRQQTAYIQGQLERNNPISWENRATETVNLSQVPLEQLTDPQRAAFELHAAARQAVQNSNLIRHAQQQRQPLPDQQAQFRLVDAAIQRQYGESVNSAQALRIAEMNYVADRHDSQTVAQREAFQVAFNQLNASSRDIFNPDSPEFQQKLTPQEQAFIRAEAQANAGTYHQVDQRLNSWLLQNDVAGGDQAEQQTLVLNAIQDPARARELFGLMVAKEQAIAHGLRELGNYQRDVPNPELTRRLYQELEILRARIRAGDYSGYTDPDAMDRDIQRLDYLMDLEEYSNHIGIVDHQEVRRVNHELDNQDERLNLPTQPELEQATQQFPDADATNREIRRLEAIPENRRTPEQRRQLATLRSRFDTLQTQGDQAVEQGNLSNVGLVETLYALSQRDPATLTPAERALLNRARAELQNRLQDPTQNFNQENAYHTWQLHHTQNMDPGELQARINFLANQPNLPPHLQAELDRLTNERDRRQQDLPAGDPQHWPANVPPWNRQFASVNAYQQDYDQRRREFHQATGTPEPLPPPTPPTGPPAPPPHRPGEPGQPPDQPGQPPQGPESRRRRSEEYGPNNPPEAENLTVREAVRFSLKRYLNNPEEYLAQRHHQLLELFNRHGVEEVSGIQQGTVAEDIRDLVRVMEFTPSQKEWLGEFYPAQLEELERELIKKRDELSIQRLRVSQSIEINQYLDKTDTNRPDVTIMRELNNVFNVANLDQIGEMVATKFPKRNAEGEPDGEVTVLNEIFVIQDMLEIFSQLEDVELILKGSDKKVEAAIVGKLQAELQAVIKAKGQGKAVTWDCGKEEKDRKKTLEKVTEWTQKLTDQVSRKKTANKDDEVEKIRDDVGKLKAELNGLGLQFDVNTPQEYDMEKGIVSKMAMTVAEVTGITYSHHCAVFGASSYISRIQNLRATMNAYAQNYPGSRFLLDGVELLPNDKKEKYGFGVFSLQGLDVSENQFKQIMGYMGIKHEWETFGTGNTEVTAVKYKFSRGEKYKDTQGQEHYAAERMRDICGEFNIDPQQASKYKVDNMNKIDEFRGKLSDYFSKATIEKAIELTNTIGWTKGAQEHVKRKIKEQVFERLLRFNMYIPYGGLIRFPERIVHERDGQKEVEFRKVRSLSEKAYGKRGFAWRYDKVFESLDTLEEKDILTAKETELMKERLTRISLRNIHGKPEYNTDFDNQPIIPSNITIPGIGTIPTMSPEARAFLLEHVLNPEMPKNTAQMIAALMLLFTLLGGGLMAEIFIGAMKDAMKESKYA